MIDKEIAEQMIAKALQSMNNSYSPYSNFKVGACVLDIDGNMYCGTNIENASFSETCCAERIAIYKALTNNHHEDKKIIKAIAVIGGLNGQPKDYCQMCGTCRQVLSQFAQNVFDCYVIMAKSVNDYKSKVIAYYLPQSFEIK